MSTFMSSRKATSGARSRAYPSESMCETAWKAKLLDAEDNDLPRSHSPNGNKCSLRVASGAFVAQVVKDDEVLAEVRLKIQAGVDLHGGADSLAPDNGCSSHAHCRCGRGQPPLPVTCIGREKPFPAACHIPEICRHGRNPNAHK